jgi:hypothetical protein
MASGNIYRIPKRNADNTVSGSRLIKSSDGTFEEVSEVIFTSDSPSIPDSFTDEINNLIDSGKIEIPNSEVRNSHIVDISDQLESGKYTYNFINSDGDLVKCSDIFRVFFNGLNVSQDIDLSADRLSFTFIDAYQAAEFGIEDSRLVIDFVEEK